MTNNTTLISDEAIEAAERMPAQTKPSRRTRRGRDV